MNDRNLFNEMLTSYPPEKRELAKEIFHRFADGDSGNFFTQLFLVLDVYAHYAEHVPATVIEANHNVMQTLQDVREEVELLAKSIEQREVNIGNHAEKTDELCKMTIAKCNETLSRVELITKNIGAQVDTKAIVQGVQNSIEKEITAKIFAPFLERSGELSKIVIPSLEKIKEATTEAHTLWRKHIWKTAWAGTSLVTFTLLCIATFFIYKGFDNYAENKAAEQIADVERVMNYNQEAFEELAITHTPIRVLRTTSDGVINPQSFALTVEGADSVDMREGDGHQNGLVFFTSNLSDQQLQLLEQETAKWDAENGIK